MTDDGENEQHRDALESIAVSVQAARRVAGLSQEAVAHAVGIPRSALSDIERSRRSLSAIELAALAEVLGVEMATLLSGEPDTRHHTSVRVPVELSFPERREVSAFAEFLIHRRQREESAPAMPGKKTTTVLVDQLTTIGEEIRDQAIADTRTGLGRELEEQFLGRPEVPRKQFSGADPDDEILGLLSVNLPSLDDPRLTAARRRFAEEGVTDDFRAGVLFAARLVADHDFEY